MHHAQLVGAAGRTTTPADLRVGVGGPAASPAYTPFPCQAPGTADLWFAERTADVESAKAMCAPCPIREACLAGAIERGEPWGVWGGEVFVDGVVVARKRGRGRPRKVGPAVAA